MDLRNGGDDEKQRKHCFGGQYSFAVFPLFKEEKAHQQHDGRHENNDDHVVLHSISSQLKANRS
jgi:hypothetical protein